MFIRQICLCSRGVYFGEAKMHNNAFRLARGINEDRMTNRIIINSLQGIRRRDINEAIKPIT